MSRNINTVLCLFLGFSTGLFAEIADFESIPLQDGVWNGSDLSGKVMSGNAILDNSYNSDWSSWSGFAVSSSTDSSTPGYANQYASVTGGGAAGSNQYAVAYEYGQGAKLSFRGARMIQSLKLSNSAYAYLAMRNGNDGYGFVGGPFESSDYLRVRITGTSPSGSAQKTVSLAEGNTIENSWIQADLSEFGMIDSLTFHIELSSSSFPSYFCLDDVQFAAGPPSFDDVLKESDAYVNGSSLPGFITSGYARFPNSFNSDWGSWSGFAVTRSTRNDQSGWIAQYDSIAKGPVKGEAFAVAYLYQSTEINFDLPQNPTGIFLSNSAYSYYSMRDGDSFAAAFTDSDHFNVIFSATDAAGNTLGSVPVSLAEGQNINGLWQWVDLSSFNGAIKIGVEINSSNAMTPAYFCMDEFGSPAPGASVPEVDIVLSSNGSIRTGDIVQVSMPTFDADVQDRLFCELLLDGKQLQLSGTSPASASFTAQSGTHALLARASDGANHRAKALNFTVTENSPPSVSLFISPTTPNKGDEVTLTVQAADLDGDPLTVTAFLDGLPLSLTGDAQSMTGTFTPASAGLHSVSATVSDGREEAKAFLNFEVMNPDASNPYPSDEPGAQQQVILDEIDRNSDDEQLHNILNRIIELDNNPASAFSSFLTPLNEGETRVIDSGNGVILTLTHTGFAQANLEHSDPVMPVRLSGLPQEHSVAVGTFELQKLSSLPAGASGRALSIDLMKNGQKVHEGFEIELRFHGKGRLFDLSDKSIPRPKLMLQQDDGSFADSGFEPYRDGDDLLVNLRHASVFVLTDGTEGFEPVPVAEGGGCLLR